MPLSEEMRDGTEEGAINEAEDTELRLALYKDGSEKVSVKGYEQLDAVNPRCKDGYEDSGGAPGGAEVNVGTVFQQQMVFILMRLAWCFLDLSSDRRVRLRRTQRLE
jgi:hypothetical protein